jgi:hypothetical protein
MPKPPCASQTRTIIKSAQLVAPWNGKFSGYAYQLFLTPRGFGKPGRTHKPGLGARKLRPGAVGVEVEVSRRVGTFNFTAFFRGIRNSPTQARRPVIEGRN